MGEILYRLNMEGDFGQDGVVFKTKAGAKKWAEKAYRGQLGDDPEEPFEDFWRGYCSTVELQVEA